MNVSVNFSITLSPQASALIRRFGDSPGLNQKICATLDDLNQNTVEEIKRRLNVAGNSRRGKKESASRDYPYPHKITSRLQNSMGKTNAVIDSTGATAIVRSAVGSGVGAGAEAGRYAAIQEYGGSIRVPSRPRRGSTKYLRGKSKNTKAFTVNVRARSYLNSTVNDRRQVYDRRLSRTVKDWFGGNN